MNNEKPNCRQHLREVAGITDMKQLATIIGDLHYEVLAELLYEVNAKLHRDGGNDCIQGRTQLGLQLFSAADCMMEARNHISKAWAISKPYMEEPKIITDITITEASLLPDGSVGIGYIDKTKQ